jgi:hypothetical protein
MKRQLGNNFEIWPQQIRDFLKADYPFIMRYLRGSITFHTADPKTGTAVGGIPLHNPSTGMQAVIPLVISKFLLLDLDTMIIENEQYVPLTETRVTEYLGGYAGRLTPKKRQGRTSPVTTSPPSRGRRGQAKTASLFKTAVNKLGVGPGMLKVLMDSMAPKKDSAIAMRLKNEIENLPYRAVWISYDKNRSTWKAKVSDDRFVITEILGKSAILAKFESFDDNLAKEMQRTDDIFLTKGSKRPFIAEDHSTPPQVITKAGEVSIITSTRAVLTGHASPDCTDLIGRSIGSALWFDGTNYCMSEKISGYYTRDSHAPRVTTLTKKQRYCFSFRDGEETKYTAPFTVSSKPEASGGALKFQAITHFGKEVTISYSKNVAEPISNMKDAVADMVGETTYHIPTTHAMVKVGVNKVSLHHAQGDSFRKSLMDNIGDSIEITGMAKDDTPYYFIKGSVAAGLSTLEDSITDPTFGKRAKDINTLIWYLVNLGFSEGAARGIESSIWEHHGTVRVGNITIFKDAPIHATPSMELLQLADEGFIPEDSVDTLLGLGFVDDLDVEDTLGHLDKLKEMEGVLAKLLFRIRLGVPLAAEETVSKGLTYLSNIIDELEQAESSRVSRRKSGGTDDGK